MVSHTAAIGLVNSDGYCNSPEVCIRELCCLAALNCTYAAAVGIRRVAGSFDQLDEVDITTRLAYTQNPSWAILFLFTIIYIYCTLSFESLVTEVSKLYWALGWLNWQSGPSFYSLLAYLAKPQTKPAKWISTCVQISTHSCVECCNIWVLWERAAYLCSCQSSILAATGKENSCGLTACLPVSRVCKRTRAPRTLIIFCCARVIATRTRVEPQEFSSAWRSRTEQVCYTTESRTYCTWRPPLRQSSVAGETNKHKSSGQIHLHALHNSMKGRVM